MTTILENTKQPTDEDEIETSLRLRLSEETANNYLIETQKSEDIPPQLTSEIHNGKRNNVLISDECPKLIPEINIDGNKDVFKETKESSSQLSLELENSQDKPLDEKEKEEYFQLLKLEKELDEELLKLRSDLESAPSKQTKMNYLHEYNNIKDATQVVLGALASMRQVTIASLHEEFNLPTADE